MSDREKVIKALECRKNADKRCGNPCEDTGLCHYATAVRGLDGEIYRPFVCDRERICADALALLKEQEAVEPKKIKGYNPPMYTLYEYKCEKCESLIMNKQPFCMGCGKPVNWE